MKFILKFDEKTSQCVLKHWNVDDGGNMMEETLIIHLNTYFRQAILYI